MSDTILCPVDFSGSSEEAARYAISLAGSLGQKKVVFLHVYQRPVYPLADGTLFMDGTAEVSVKNQLRRQLDLLASRYSAHDVEVAAELHEGIPHQVIIEHASAVGASMIVMATHGRKGLSHLLLGSVAEKVVRLSPIPVCTLRVTD